MYKKSFDSCIVPLVIIVFSVKFVHCDVFEACITVKDRTFVASKASCSHYIYCDGANSYEGVCADGDYFNQRYQTCDPKELVECELENVNSSPPMPPLPTTAITTQTQPTIGTTTTVSSSLATTASTGASTTNTITSTTRPTSVSTTDPTPATITSSNQTTATTNQSTPTDPALIISVECPPTDNPQQMVFVPHPTTCSDYFICYHGVALQMHCSAMLHFNTHTVKCDYAENVRCQTNFLKPKEQCQPHTVDLFPHQTNCNYFYYCRNGYLLLQQCPFAWGWDYEKRTCIALDQAKCYNKIRFQV